MNIIRSRICTQALTRLQVKKYVQNEATRVSFSNSKVLCQIINSKANKPDIFSIEEYYKDDKEDQFGRGLFAYLLLSVPITTFILGTWQIFRRKEKLKLIEDLNERCKAEPVDLPEDLSDIYSKEYCAVKAKGTFLYNKEFLIGPRTLIIDGVAATETSPNISAFQASGYYVVTPFKLADRDLTILVNRGWIPKSKRDPKARNYDKVQGVTEIVGRIRTNEEKPPFFERNRPDIGEWIYRDVTNMALVNGTDPIFIDMTSKNPKGGPISSQTKVTVRNDHETIMVNVLSGRYKQKLGNATDLNNINNRIYSVLVYYKKTKTTLDLCETSVVMWNTLFARYLNHFLLNNNSQL